MNKEDEKVLQPKIASRDVTMHILKAFGLRMSKKLGQNFLIDARIVQGIVDAAEVKPGDRVLEIGPGIGTLTQGLAEAGADVTAVELDKKLPAVLKETLKAYDNVRIVPGDILKVNIPTGVPLVYTFDTDFNVLDKRYIGDPATIAAKIDAVANQGKAHK